MAGGRPARSSLPSIAAIRSCARAGKRACRRCSRSRKRSRTRAPSSWRAALTRKPNKPVAITNANVFDAATGQSLPGSTVLIDGNRIRAVGKDGSVTIPSQAERIDAWRQSAAAGPVGHARPHRADRRHAAHGRWRHVRARPRERQRRDCCRSRSRSKTARRSDRASPCAASWTAAARTPGRPRCSSTPRPRRAARSRTTRSSATTASRSTARSSPS